MKTKDENKALSLNRSNIYETILRILSFNRELERKL